MKRIGILTAGGSDAFLKWWVPGAAPEVVWTEDFGGRWSRMRDIEVGDLYGDGSSAIAVATHDQGVVAVVRPLPDDTWQVRRLDARPGIFVHEVESKYVTPFPSGVDGTGNGNDNGLGLGTDEAAVGLEYSQEDLWRWLSNTPW